MEIVHFAWSPQNSPNEFFCGTENENEIFCGTVKRGHSVFSCFYNLKSAFVLFIHTI